MLSFSHKNVMSLIGLCFDGEVPLLIMPFMINGTVLNYIKQNRENLYFGQSADKKQVCFDRAIIIYSNGFLSPYEG